MQDFQLKMRTMHENTKPARERILSYKRRNILEALEAKKPKVEKQEQQKILIKNIISDDEEDDI